VQFSENMLFECWNLELAEALGFDLNGFD
jgi:hypothetical protein